MALFTLRGVGEEEEDGVRFGWMVIYYAMSALAASTASSNPICFDILITFSPSSNETMSLSDLLCLNGCFFNSHTRTKCH